MSKTYVSAVPLTMVRLAEGGCRNVLEGDPIVGEADEEVALPRVAGLLEQVERTVAGGDLRADGHVVPADLLPELPGAGGDVILPRLQPAAGHEPEMQRPLVRPLGVEPPELPPRELVDHPHRACLGPAGIRTAQGQVQSGAVPSTALTRPPDTHPVGNALSGPERPRGRAGARFG